MQKEIPILFSTPMVQAILEGRKSETRRTRGLKHININPGNYYFQSLVLHVSGRFTFAPAENYQPTNEDIIQVKNPYGDVGDLLWVRESFCPGYFDNGKHAYKADWNSTAAEYVNEPKWKPSIHMPKVAARIWLQNEGVTVERLQDIKPASAIAEGIQSFRPVPGDGVPETLYKHYLKDKWGLSPVHSVQTLWQKINGPKSWDINPWVWVVKFKVLSTTGKP